MTRDTYVQYLLREWPLVFVCGCLVFMIWPMLDADFGMIDDHEIVSIVGRDKRVSVTELSPLIQQFAIESNGRFRPGYYVFRIVEAFCFRLDAGLWHTNRLLLAVVSSLALYVATRVVLQPFLAGAITLLFFSGSQNEIWIHLGPAESYGVPLTLIGIAWIAVQLGRQQWQPVRLLPGFVLLWIAGFVKESFIPVLPAALLLTYVVMPLVLSPLIPRRSHLRLRDGLVLLCLLLGVGVQIGLTAWAIQAHGRYTGDASITGEASIASFLYALKPMLVSYSRNTLWFLPLLAGFVTLLPRHPQQWLGRGWHRDLVKVAVLSTAGGILILGPQAVIYVGNTSPAGRYLTPGNLFVTFAASLGFYLLSSNVIARSYLELRGVVAGMLIGVALLGILGSYREADAAALSTQKFQTKLAEIVHLKSQHPELPLLFYSTDVSDREPLVSVASYLAVELPTPNRPFLNTYDWEAGAETPLEIALANLIREQSVQGDKLFDKIADFPGSNGHCIAVIFSGPRDGSRCAYSIHMRDQR
ncbi:MAG TPA: hypothetical protein VM818_17060 [Vicinamibacterales bacterium]|nr:hypothetical protein [Vicinamibacterales bacterium]